MNLRQLASKIAKREGKKHQASIGDIREILRIQVDLEEKAARGDGRNSPCRAIGNAVNERLRSSRYRAKKKKATRRHKS